MDKSAHDAERTTLGRILNACPRVDRQGVVMTDGTTGFFTALSQQGPDPDLSVDLLVFGFSAPASMRSDIAHYVDDLRGRGVIRLLDLLFVSRDAEGIFHAHRGDHALEGEGVPIEESTLWHLLVGGSAESGLADTPLARLTSWDVGLDLDWIERLPQLIEPGSSALLMLVEPSWAADLRDVVERSGGFPIVFGCLARETMLVVGPDLAAAASAARASEHAAGIRGAAMLQVLERGEPSAAIILRAMTALLRADVLLERDIDGALGALAAAGLIPQALVARARAQANRLATASNSRSHRPDNPLN